MGVTPNLNEYNGRLYTCAESSLILHSKEDELIGYQHAVRNSQKSNTQLIEITGTHNRSIISQLVLDQVRNFINK